MGTASPPLRDTWEPTSSQACWLEPLGARGGTGCTPAHTVHPKSWGLAPSPSCAHIGAGSVLEEGAGVVHTRGQQMAAQCGQPHPRHPCSVQRAQACIVTRTASPI